MNAEYKNLRVGLIGLGLEAYWSQFEGLKQRLEGYLSEVEGKIKNSSRTIVNLGLVDSPPKAIVAGHACRSNDIDLLLVHITTYALSSTVLPVILQAKVPVIFLNIQPTKAIDYGRFNRMGNRTAMTGEWLAYCSSCPVPEIANVMRRLDMPFHQVTGVLHDDPQCWLELEGWIAAAAVAKGLSHSNLGLMGNYYSGMLDIATDLVQVSGRFGVRIEHLEIEELCSIRRNVSEDDIARKMQSFASFFAISDDCTKQELIRAARTAVALDTLVVQHELDLMAYYHKGTGIAEAEDVMSSVILGTSMLTGRGVPVAGEYEVKNAIAMKIMDLFGTGGSFTEYYAVDFASDLVLMGHDGPGHVNIAQDKIQVRPLQVYHGKVGNGLSVEMSVKYGPVTLLSIVENRRRGFALLVAQGESIPGAVLEIGNTNSRYSFPLGARGFIEAWNSHGPAHHCAIGVGHIGPRLEMLARLLDLDFCQVC